MHEGVPCRARAGLVTPWEDTSGQDLGGRRRARPGAGEAHPAPASSEVGPRAGSHAPVPRRPSRPTRVADLKPGILILTALSALGSRDLHVKFVAVELVCFSKSSLWSSEAGPPFPLGSSASWTGTKLPAAECFCFRNLEGRCVCVRASASLLLGERRCYKGSGVPEVRVHSVCPRGCSWASPWHWRGHTECSLRGRVCPSLPLVGGAVGILRFLRE